MEKDKNEAKVENCVKKIIDVINETGDIVYLETEEKGDGSQSVNPKNKYMELKLFFLITIAAAIIVFSIGSIILLSVKNITNIPQPAPSVSTSIMAFEAASTSVPNVYSESSSECNSTIEITNNHRPLTNKTEVITWRVR